METTETMTDKKKGNSGSGTFDAYSVEAMCDYGSAQEVGGQIFDNRWKRVDFEPSKIGVPVGPSYQIAVLNQVHLLSYPAAQALRWWFHAACETFSSGLCMRSRIVQHRVIYSYSEERVSEHMEIGGDDRSNTMPNWGKKPEKTEDAA